MCRTVEIAQYINSLSSEDDSFDFGSAADESDQYNCSNSMFSTVTQTVLLAAIAVKMIRTCNLLKKYESFDDEGLHSDDCSTCDDQIVENVQFVISLFLNFFSSLIEFQNGL